MTDRPGIVSSRWVAAALAGAALVAWSDGEAREWPSAPLRGQITEQPPCSCRGPTGKSVELGQELCLKTASGPKRARCVMVINNTSWQVGPERCDPDPDLTN